MNDRKKIVFLTGAGVSAESGIKTFRDSNGLWENHDIHEVASPEGWRKNRGLVLEFYNQRRKQLLECEPNAAHYLIASLEKDYDVVVVTQNVDDLHERAGSTKVIHLHGELLKACSSMNKELTVEWKGDINIGDKHADGSQLRPFIVWFGESVPLIEYAGEEVKSADILVVCGTSLQVYPAAGLMNHARYGAKRFYIDPSPDYGILPNSVSVIPKIASEGMLDFIETLQDS